MNEATVSDQPAPPDLPSEMLTETAGSQQSTMPSSAAASAPPAPDLPEDMLAPTSQDAPRAYEAVGPDLGDESLTPATLRDPAEAPAPHPAFEPARSGLGFTDPPVADSEAWAPSPSIPTTAAALPSNDEQTFEEKWDSLARRLQTGSTVPESPATPAPPDLPEEMLRQVGEVEVTGGEDHYEDD